MIIYGRNPVREALRGSRSVERIWATKNAAREQWLAAGQTGEGRRLHAGGPPVVVESAQRIEAMCGSPAHQGVCAAVSAFRYREAADLLAKSEPLIVALDQVQDPQNLGAVCRVAECAGAAGLVIAERRSATVTAAVCKASAGAVEHLPVARVRNLVDFLDQAKAASLWCYGTDADAPMSYDDVDLTGGVVLILGSEGSGLRRRVAETCDLLIRIPLQGRISSLSVATAAAVLLYGSRRQRELAGA